MSNLHNKDRNKIKDKDEIRTAWEALILTQQAKHKQKFQQLTDGYQSGEGEWTEGVHSPSRSRSVEDLFEKMRQRLNLVEETREEFLNLYTPRIENPNGREGTYTARSTEEARAWDELFVPDTPNEWIQVENRTTLLEEDLFTPNKAVVQSSAVVRSSVVLQNSAGTQNSASA